MTLFTLFADMQVTTQPKTVFFFLSVHTKGKNCRQCPDKCPRERRVGVCVERETRCVVSLVKITVETMTWSCCLFILVINLFVLPQFVFCVCLSRFALLAFKANCIVCFSMSSVRLSQLEAKDESICVCPLSGGQCRNRTGEDRFVLYNIEIFSCVAATWSLNNKCSWSSMASCLGQNAACV